MTHYLLIESGEPFGSADVVHHYTLARELARGEDVTLFLVENGVLATRRVAAVPDLRAVLDGGVRVLADDFSLRERGIRPEELLEGIETAPIEAVVDRLGEGHKALWL